MRIFSKFHDFYDIGLQYGSDPNCVYKRTTKEFYDDCPEGKEIIEFASGRFGWNPFGYSNDSNIILFCGEAYFCLTVSTGYVDDYKVHYIYTEKALIDLINANNKEHKFKYAITKDGKLAGSYMNNPTEYFKQFGVESYDSKIVDLLIKFGVPIIKVCGSRSRDGYRKIILNPRLNDIQFYRVIDPYNAFQKLSMFISGVMGGQAPPMIQVSDTIRLEKHGFDKIRSFRNMDKE